MSRARRGAYRVARTLGDLEAAARGPGPFGRRVIRRTAYRGVNRLLAKALKKGLGL